MAFNLIPKAITIASKATGAFPLETGTWKYTKTGLMYSGVMFIGGLLQLYYTGPTIYFCVQDVHKSTDVVNLSFAVLISLSNMGSKYITVFLLKSHMQKISFKVHTVDDYFETVYSLKDGKKAGHSAIAIFLVYSFVIAPVNIAKLISFYQKDAAWDTITFYTFMYLQNFSSACTELQYISLSLNLHQRFKKMNEVLRRISRNVGLNSSDHFSTNDPLHDSLDGSRSRFEPFGSRFSCGCTAYRGDSSVFAKPVPGFCSSLGQKTRENYSTRPASHTHRIEAEEIENLRFCHLSVREALLASYKLYRTQFFFSLSTCFSLTVMELYYGFILGKHAKLRPKIIFWLLQFCLRFSVPTIVSQATTNEATYGRTLISNICTKMKGARHVEELMLFSADIKSCNMEFSVFGFFTIDTRLITSAIAAGSTYLVILLQFQR